MDGFGWKRDAAAPKRSCSVDLPDGVTRNDGVRESIAHYIHILPNRASPPRGCGLPRMRIIMFSGGQGATQICP